MFKKCLLSTITFVLLFTVYLFPLYGSVENKEVYSANICPSNIIEKIMQFVRPSANVGNPEVEDREFVYVSGRPIGFSIDGGGVVVVTMGEIMSGDGYIKSPCEEAGVKTGDIIVRVEGTDITSGERLIDIVNARGGKPCNLEISRNGKKINIEVTPKFDKFALSYRLGVWVRDNAVGVGTVTYVTEDNSFSALGHPITDADTSTVFPVGVGKVFKCSIVGIKKGERGEPGELKGLFLKNSNEVGLIESNTYKGVSGSFASSDVAEVFHDKELTEVAFISEVKPGSATIYTTIDGGEPQKYDIEIIKTNHVNSYGNKCMVIRITDQKLINATSGIVQGMSGSPILQDGRLVGCVTHVFINDPTKGFADFITIK